MKRVGIVTYQWYDNYGTVLQAYALQHSLVKLGCDTHIIPLMTAHESLLHRMVAKSVRGTLQKWNKILREGWNRRHNSFERFRTAYFNYGGQKPLAFSDATKKDYREDALVFGSDNIWSRGCYYANSDMAAVFLGDGIKHSRKFAYAASTGGRISNDPHCNTTIDRIKNAGFLKVSLREAVNMDVFAERGVIAEVVPDPSLLLTAQEWNAVATGPSEKYAYVFGYDLGHKGGISVRKGCDVIAKENGYRVRIPYPIRWWHDRSVAVRPGPEEWLSLISNASFVVTNSFHGVMFSLIFNRPFVFVKIQDRGERGELNMRALDILKTAGLEDRIVSSEQDIRHVMDMPIDWTVVNAKIGRFRQVGIDYLKEVAKGI